MRTNEPQPAPIESILTSGMLSTKRAMSGVGVTSKRPSVISAMSKQVPPMSVQSTFGRPMRSASHCAADDAADRPGDQRACRARLASIEIVPPCEAITRSSKPAPCFARAVAHRCAACRARARPRRPRSPSCSAAAGRGASGTAREERNTGTSPSTPRAAFSSSRISADALLVRRVAVAEEQRDDDRPRRRRRAARSAASRDVLLAQRQHLVAEQVDPAAHAVDRARAAPAARCGGGWRRAGGRA